jgi:hypothetical protein
VRADVLEMKIFKSLARVSESDRALTEGMQQPGKLLRMLSPVL